MLNITLQRSLLVATPLVGFLSLPTDSPAADDHHKPPNIIYILADDLGYAELGCYGQTKIKTPNIDRIAAEGIRFTQHYSGSPVCAPSRCILLTGLHTGHAYIRDNKEMGGWQRDAREGQLHIPEETLTISKLLQGIGYATSVIGKWGLGGPDTVGHPNQQGFDHFFGYLCQRVAHNYYPTHLWRNNDKVMLEGNEWFSAHQRLEEPPSDPAQYDQYSGSQYAPDLMIEEALQFVRAHEDEPFFLYYATPVPHAAIQVPDDSVEPYAELGWDKEPYLGQKGYLPHPCVRAGYAAMVSRMDRDIGRLLSLLDELELADNTIVMFTSDNGPTFNGGTDSTFFESAGSFRGLKCSLYEGGIRVPLVARWPGHIPAGKVTHHLSAFWDVMPTLCEMIDIESTPDIDGISFLPALTGRGEDQPQHEYLYWEYRGHQAVRKGKWKAVWRKNAESIELYDLTTDIGEQHNVAAEHDGVVQSMMKIMTEGRTPSEHFPLKRKREGDKDS